VRHLDDFVAAYNFARRLKTLNGLTPYEFVCKQWTIEPKRFTLNPLQKMPGIYIRDLRLPLYKNHYLVDCEVREESAAC
jgi:hypothetical protein